MYNENYLSSLPGNDAKIWLRLDLHTNTEFQNFKIEMQVLNSTAIANGYAGHDPQGGTSDGSFFLSSLLGYKVWLKFFF